MSSKFTRMGQTSPLPFIPSQFPLLTPVRFASLRSLRFPAAIQSVVLHRQPSTASAALRLTSLA